MSMPELLLALALWGAWLAYWILSPRGHKPHVRRESALSRALQTSPITLGGLLVLVPDLGWRPFDDHVATPAPAAGLGLLVAGLLFTIWARRCLGDNWSADVAIRERQELVRSGPYRLVRHPIYTGGLIAVAGCVVMGAQWRGLVGFVLVLSTLAWKLRLEERWLSELFGDSYAAYQSEVPALVPDLPWFTRATR
jgi:protein-S-isoprenylcysteine O-methyltransferase Ste14